MKELFHDGAPCPECEERTGSPAIKEGVDTEVVPDGLLARRLECSVCGHEWEAPSTHEIARAWFAYGAWQQNEREKERRDKLEGELAAYQAAVKALSKAYGE